jgi:hypothetical protein
MRRIRLVNENESQFKQREYEKESQKHQADFCFIFRARFAWSSQLTKAKAACFTRRAQTDRMAGQ